MIGAEIELPDFKEFLRDLEDASAARKFLLQVRNMSYTIDELPRGVDIRTLEDAVAVDLAKKYWGQVFLSEYPDFGEYEQ